MQLPTSYLCYTCERIYISATLLGHPTVSFPRCVHKEILKLCYIQKCLKAFGFPGGSVGKEFACQCRKHGSDPIPGSGRSPGKGNGNSLLHSCREIPCAEEPGRLQSMGLQRVALNLVTEQQQHGILLRNLSVCADPKLANRVVKIQASVFFKALQEFSWAAVGLRTQDLGYLSLHCVCAPSLQSSPALRNPMDGSPPGSFVHGIFLAGILEWVAISFSRGSSWPRDQTRVSCISYIAGRLFIAEAPGKPTFSSLSECFIAMGKGFEVRAGFGILVAV